MKNETRKTRRHTTFWTFDFETVQRGKSVYVTIATWMFSKDNNIYSASELDKKDPITSMLDHMVKYYPKGCHKPKDCHILFAHNGANFDNFFMIAWLLKNGYHQVPENHMLEEHSFFLLASDLNKNLRLEFVYKGKIFIIKDSIRFLCLPLRGLGKMLGDAKLEADNYYGKSILELEAEDQQKYLEYAKQDTKILMKSILMYHKKYPSVLSEKTHTQATISLKDWRDNSIMEYKDYEYLKENEMQKRRHYSGGFTCVNSIYENKIVEKVYYYDINSSYPAIMLKSVAVRQIPAEQAFLYDSTYILTVFIKKATLKPYKVPILRNITSQLDNSGEYAKNIVFTKEYNGNCIFHQFWEEEWNWILKTYDVEYEIIDKTYFKKKPIFKRYIEKFRAIKENAVEMLAKDITEQERVYYGFEKQISKLFSNSLYGKFATKGFYSNHYYVKTEAEIRVGDIINVCGMDCYVFNCKKPIYEGVQCFNIIKIEDRNVWSQKDQKNVFISSYITMKGRVALYEMIDKIGFHNFVYADTDSIISRVPFEEKYLSNSIYGKWKLEGKYNYFKALRSKCYVCSDTFNLGEGEVKNKKFAISGIKNPYFMVDKGLTLEDFNAELETTQTSFVTMLGGKGTVERIKKVIKN